MKRHQNTEYKMSKNKKEEQAADPHAPIYETSNRASRSMIAVIDTMCQRGAFKGEELSTIGQLRDQCVQVIQLAENYQQEQATAE